MGKDFFTNLEGDEGSLIKNPRDINFAAGLLVILLTLNVLHCPNMDCAASAAFVFPKLTFPKAKVAGT